jgi:hypothetical protein
MGDGGITIDIGDALPYLEDRLRQLIGKDEQSQQTATWFSNLQKTALALASHVQCIGMHRPIPLAKIYQPTRLKLRGAAQERNKEEIFRHGRMARSLAQGYEMMRDQTLSVDHFLERHENAVIYAGPGWGKTTFLHHVFLKSIQRRALLPVLITLRRPNALEDLEKFVTLATRVQKKEGKSETLLLVDGYDELSVEQRKRVSEALLQYDALKLGSFYVTCREYYHVFEVVASEARIDGFTIQDQYRYVKTFLRAFGSTLDPIAVVNDFHERGFDDFLSHPLLLALACIVKTSAVTVNSRSVIRLLERAIDVLTYRWDEAKGIDRTPRTPLDGRDRIQVLRRIAYRGKSRHLSESRALTLAQQQIELLQCERIDPKQVLLETAQFFGIFVPTEEGWEFVHKTLHDYLAAQFWVETGEFAKCTGYDWDARTAYAACLTQDATDIMEHALRRPDGVEMFVEMLSNAPTFDSRRIASALIKYYSGHFRVHYYEAQGLTVTASLVQDFVCLATVPFLDYLVERCAEQRGQTTDTIAGYCMLELARRGRKLSFVTYDKALALYKSPEFTFYLQNSGNVRLSALNPRSP